MYLSPHEANLLECSIFHYFIWRQQEANATDADKYETTAVDTNDNSPLRLNHLHNNYMRIIQVLKEELPDVALSEAPTLSSSSPEVCFRWLKYATIRNILVNTEIPRTLKRKRDMADETVNLAKALKSIPEDAITLENAKEVMSTLRDEHTEVKKITESLELKLSQSEKFYSDLIKFNDEKLRLEKKLENLESEEAKTEQNLNDQHAKEMKEGEGDQSNFRAKLETKKRRVQLQETMYANAILFEVHEKERQMEAKNKNFETRLQQLIEFKQEFGHCHVGLDYNKGLNAWLVQQRRYYRWKHARLTPERIAKLDALGVVWDVDHLGSRSFEEYVEQCRDFKEAHGHLRIPSLIECNEDGTEPSEDDVRFRLWAQSKRQQYIVAASGRKGAGLDKHRIAILDGLGFQWSVDATNTDGGSIDVENQTPGEIMFRTRIEQLRKVKEICGNCNEKKHILSVFPNNDSLYTWVKTQRQRMKLWLAGKRIEFSEERREMLRSIEFDHEPRKHFTPTTSTKKKWPTKMEILALELKEREKNQDSENVSGHDNSDSDV